MTNDLSTPEDEPSLMTKLRRMALPIKPGDNGLIKLGKNLAFSLFFILFSCVTFAIIAAILFAL
jgi:hypothetical protein